MSPEVVDLDSAREDLLDNPLPNHRLQCQADGQLENGCREITADRTDVLVEQVRQLWVDLLKPVAESVSIGHMRGPLPVPPGGHPPLPKSCLGQSPGNARLVHAASLARDHQALEKPCPRPCSTRRASAAACPAAVPPQPPPRLGHAFTRFGVGSRSSYPPRLWKRDRDNASAEFAHVERADFSVKRHGSRPR